MTVRSVPLTSLSTNLKCAENPKFVLAILKFRKRFEALRNFTLESGQEEIDRLNQLRKDSEGSEQVSSPVRSSRNGSVDSLRSPLSARTPSLSGVPEESGDFAIGDDGSDDEEHDQQPTPSQSSVSNHNSRTASVSSSVDDAVPLQLRGMSEKARGKQPVGAPVFGSRVNSMSSMSSHPAGTTGSNGDFMPSAQWVRLIMTSPSRFHAGYSILLLTAPIDRFMASFPPAPHNSHPPIQHTERHSPQNPPLRHRPLSPAYPSLRMVSPFPRLVRIPPLELHLRLRNGSPEGYDRYLE